MNNNIENEELYRSVYMEGYYFKFSTVLYDEGNVIRYMIGSFLSGQVAHNALALINKGIGTRSVDDIHLTTSKKSYIAKMAKGKDENNGDGVHAVIYHKNDRVLKVYNNENPIDLLYKWITENTKTGILEEWKTYFFNELTKRDMFVKCQGFDYTGVAPSIYTVSKEITTELIQSIKSLGLKLGEIKLPVPEVESLDLNMSFLDIMEKIVIPHMTEEEYYYNIGDEISPIISSDIVSGNKVLKLYPRQAIIGQGMLNAIKNGKNSIICNGGTGVGKTYVSAKTTLAVLKEVQKKDNARVAIYMPSHMQKKWIRQFNECSNPLGIYPNYYTINHFTDINRIPKVTKGIDVLIFPQDRAKRHYINGFVSKTKKNMLSEALNKYIVNGRYNAEDTVIIKECSSIKDSEMRVAARKIEIVTRRKVVLYKPIYNEDFSINSYKVVTTSETLKTAFGSSKSSYDFLIDEVSDIEETIKVLQNVIEQENISMGLSKIFPMICPHCYGAIYNKSSDLFDTEQCSNYIDSIPSDRKIQNNKCNHYIKCDGSTLTNVEIDSIRSGRIQYKEVDKKSKYAYLNVEGETLYGEDLARAKKGIGEFTILVMKCNKPLWGYEETKGYRCYSAVKYYNKLFGNNSIDCSITDEAHLFATTSNRGEAYGELCRSSKVMISLTGTLTGGRASDIFYILWRNNPSKMAKMGYSYTDIGPFIDHYGRRKKVTKQYHEKSYTKSGNGVISSGWNEIPGISPMLYTNFLQDCMVSRKLEDLKIPMVPLKYFEHKVEMSEELSRNYNDLKDQFINFMNKHKDIPVGGSYINNLLSYCDMPQQADIYFKKGDTLIASPKFMDLEGVTLPKEHKLIETCKKEIAEGRKVLVYSVFSGLKGVSDRLMDVLSKHFKVAELRGSGKGSVKLIDREDWIEKQHRNGIDIIVTNPATVDTGLDIVQYPSIYFYELPYNVKTVRQAEKRAWRPNQTVECRIYYSYYKDTLQQDAIKLIGAKKASSLALEGVFSNY